MRIYELESAKYSTEELANFDLYYCEDCRIMHELQEYGFNYSVINGEVVFIATPKLKAVLTMLKR